MLSFRRNPHVHIDLLKQMKYDGSMIKSILLLAPATAMALGLLGGNADFPKNPSHNTSDCHIVDAAQNPKDIILTSNIQTMYTDLETYGGKDDYRETSVFEAILSTNVANGMFLPATAQQMSSTRYRTSSTPGNRIVLSSSGSAVTGTNTASSVARPGLLFSGDFETGDLSQWASNQSRPGAVTIVNDPVRSGNYAAKFSVNDNDTKANYSMIPNNDPRAQLTPEYRFYENDEFYISLSTFYPSDFPTVKDWLVIFGMHGEPFNGPSTINISVIRDQIHFNARGHGAIWVSPPICKGSGWQDLILHFKLSPDPNVGFVEIWHNGNMQTLANNSTRFHYATLQKGINWTGTSDGYIQPSITQYRSAAEKLGTVVLYHDNFRIGSTFDSVATNDDGL